jgi:NAD(P)-dependent dehydrogenase (short-subunit alcohol dehydrogenase family)
LKPEPFRDNAVVVTGASRGIGREMALQLADQGASLALAARDGGTAFGPDGKPLGTSPVREGEVMTAETCAQRILRAAAGRRRELVMTRRGRIGMWLKLLAPGLIDRIAQRAIERGR